MKNRFKIFTVFVGCFLFRLLPLRAPNLEPIMASLMPVSRKYGYISSFLFGFVSIVLYDVVTGHIGIWTWTTSIAYGIIGVFSVLFFKKYSSKTSNFVIFAFVGTIFFDIVTGILFAPYFGQSMWSATVMQIPFTFLHLAGNIGFAVTLSPILNRWFFSERFFSFKKVSGTSSAFAE
jgi:uncharacterized membrane protein